MEKYSLDILRFGEAERRSFSIQNYSQAHQLVTIWLRVDSLLFILHFESGRENSFEGFTRGQNL
ncbi:hypothetical protein HMPREF0645_1442 [Hallella bergensis DSM 17361]|uniref:Uncharacterized protein n=1 Tax=Hallella bergensis DSM 17361 TaxID=585502 RepID=D1PWV7_9BACT|nr:hypothetical protein HMPREF0645_1442 [Hallella bergensis DSM 17361]